MAARFNWRDPLLLDRQLTDDERMVRDTARAYCQDKLAPRVLEAFRSEHEDVGARSTVSSAPWTCSASPFPNSTAAPVSAM